VGACSFYIDPTHRAPIPPVLLEFLTEQAGFTGTWLARVNGDTLGSPLEMVPSGMPGAPQVNRSIDLVNAALFAPPDYAVIAQKGGGASTIEDSEELVRLCGTEPGGRTGLRPSEAESRLRAAEAAAQDAESRLQAAEAAAQDAEARVLALQVDLETLAQAAETRVAALEGEVQRALAGARRWKANAMEAEGAIDRLEEQAHAAEAKALRSAQESRDAWARLARVSRSSSWRATAPLRGLMKIVSRGGSSAGGSDEKSPTSDAPAGETIPSAVVDPGLMDLPESEREVLTDLEQALDHHSE